MAKDVGALDSAVADLEFKRMFAKPADPNNCFINIQAGTGGTEAQDWAQMLMRPFLRYCERKGFKPKILEESPGEVAGLKSASIKAVGDYPYGFLRTETRGPPPGAPVALRFLRRAPHLVCLIVCLP